MTRLSAAQRRAFGRVSRAHAAGVQTAQRRFTVALRAIMRGVHAAFMDYLEPAGKALVADAAKKKQAVKRKIKGPGTKPTKSAAQDIQKVQDHVIPQIAPMVATAHVQLEGALAANYAATMTEVMPIGWERLASTVKAEAAIHRDWTIKLVEDAARVYAQQVRDVFNDPEETTGKRWEELKASLLERGSVSESRAELIARDQTLKLNGAITKANQQAAGVDKYVWSTSRDERVRDTHAELDGKVFSWAAPPKPGHPGQDYQCRCIAVPLLEDD